MKYIVTIIGLIIGLNLYSQNNELTDLIISSLKIYEPNPTQIETSDSLNHILIGLLENSKEINIKDLFIRLYDNSYIEFEDNAEMRRIKMRLCLCYASIALLSDKDRYEYFIDLAQYSISDSIGKSIEFLEKQFCGLFLLKILIKTKYNLSFQIDLKDLDYQLDYYKNSLSLDFYNKSKQIVQQYEK